MLWSASEGPGRSVALLAGWAVALSLLLVLLIVLSWRGCAGGPRRWIEPGHPPPGDVFAHLVDESGAASVTNLQGVGATWQGYGAWLRFGATDDYIDALIAKGFERAEWPAICYRFELPPDYGQSFDPPWDPGAIPEKECYKARVTNDWTHSGEHYIVIDRSTGTVYFVGVGA